MDALIFLLLTPVVVGAGAAWALSAWKDKSSGLHCYLRGHDWKDHDGDIRALSCPRCGASHINIGY